jgi:serine/threonine protein kinase
MKDRAQLHDLQRLAAGSQGIVYTMSNVRINANFDAAFKEYKPSIQVDFGVIDKMVNFINSLSFAEGSRLFSLTSWPAEVVRDHNRPCGFIMPLVPKQFYISMTLSADRRETTLGAFQHLLNADDFLARRAIPLSERLRYELLVSVAQALDFLHGYDIVVGDFSPKNLLFSLETDRPCYFVDCDAMQLGGSSALQQLETPDWSVRDVNHTEPLATKESDRYKFALLVLRLLCGSQDARSLQSLPSGVDADLRALITQGISANPNSRPAPRQWIKPLREAASKASMAPAIRGTETTTTSSSSLKPIVAVSPSKPPTNSAKPLVAPSTTPQTTSNRATQDKSHHGLLIASILVVLVILAIVMTKITAAPSSSSGSSGAGSTSQIAWSSPQSADPSGALNSSSCPSASFCVAVDENGNALTYNGTSWSQPQLVDRSGGFTSVSCTSATFLVAVDGRGNALIGT